MSSSKKQTQRIAIRPGNDGNRTSSSASYKDSCELIDLSSYKQIRLEHKNLVVCGAKVTMEALVRFTLQHKMIPKVVAEFRNITVGGAISGAALESTSHLYGEMMDIVAWVKARKGNGDVVTSYKGDALWCSLSGTYGSMGIVLEAALECVPAKPYVQVSYFVFDEIQQATAAIFKAAEEKRHVFLDGLVLNRQNASVVIQGEMIGNFADIQPPTSKPGWTTKLRGGKFYYEHVQDLVSSHVQRNQKSLPGPFFQEVISMEDYIFRFDYGAFWMARPMAFEPTKMLSYLPFIIGLFVASYRWVRVITGPLFTTQNLFRMLKKAPEAVVAKRMVVQDCYIPLKNVNSFLTWVLSTIPISTPIWLCPVRTNSNQPFTPSYDNKSSASSIMLNCGIYGRVSDGKGAEYTGRLEKECHKVGGRKMLYAQNHYSKESFWKIYNKSEYDRQREQHAASESFPGLDEKTCGVPEPQNTWKETIISLFL
ncbi:MAG: hypothetical protein SGILL_002085 [Bacillariaceae sp.]